MMNKQAVKQVRSAICTVLREQWNPIGINNDPQTFGEYDSYADGICSLLLRGATDKDLTHFLRHTETVNMGCPASREESLAMVVGALRAISLKPPNL